jgi:hypothetical protein
VSRETLIPALAFLVIVGFVILVGVVVGMIVAGRIDRLMAPRPRTPAQTPPPGEPASADPPPAPDEEEQA